MSLTVRDLTVAFDGTVAVDRVDLEVPAGSVTAVLGPSGSGKSTLLRAVAGLESPASGTIRYGDEDLARVPTHRRGFALMFQDGQLFPHQSVARNIGYPLRLRRLPSARIADRIAELLDLVGLAGFGDRTPATLSGGERQRVALARSLAVEPRMLLLDEPLSALDRGLRERLATDLHDILRRAGTTTLLVTHDHEEAFAIADRMAVMRAGRIVQSGDLAEVWAHPTDAWAARFLGYAGVLSGEQAAVLRAVIDPSGSWTEVALRRSALVVDPDGPLSGVVLAARVSPEQTRLEVDVDGLGTIAAVADPARPAAVGERVRLAVRTDRLATLPETQPSEFRHLSLE
ncbi:ABC transporter ATP-binding protein [Nocardioides marmoriginsengisoli]|uniref:ABC-type quaternary amine transporter n=1 Tax=Nocardioides marmoriginsengisoli TaxID=661483 RepID=A0A3N0CFI9_9ACTN|nr:ABC transporter ATP-binding protein [Nocardioides marmoriginsengisoli]RNL62208.1 ABC transporter ATP-binding protein [Nocardioides marmoriginsengisoli]